MFSLVCNRHHGKVFEFSQDIFIPFKKSCRRLITFRNTTEIVTPAVLTSY